MYYLAKIIIKEALWNKDNKYEIQKAMELYNKSASHNITLAQYELGELYYTGNVIEQSPEHAIYWFKRARENGNKDASLKLENIENICRYL